MDRINVYIANNDMTTKKPDAPKSLGRSLNFTASVGNAVVARLLEPHGLTLAQWAVLSSLWRNGPLGVNELARLTGNAAPAVSRLVDRMVRAGLLDRQTDPADRRAVKIGLTARTEAMRPLATIWQEVNAVLLAGLDEGEAERLFELLGRVEAAGRDWLAAKDALR